MSITFIVPFSIIIRGYTISDIIISARKSTWDRVTSRTIAASNVCEQITYDHFREAHPDMQPPDYRIYRYYRDDFGDCGSGYEVKSRHNTKPGYLIQKKAITKIKQLKEFENKDTMLFLYSCLDDDLKSVTLEYYGDISGLIIDKPYSKNKQNGNYAALYLPE
jgi:hypothetical protein